MQPPRMKKLLVAIAVASLMGGLLVARPAEAVTTGCYTFASTGAYRGDRNAAFYIVSGSLAGWTRVYNRNSNQTACQDPNQSGYRTESSVELQRWLGSAGYAMCNWD